jgi:hypothetical protein
MLSNIGDTINRLIRSARDTSHIPIPNPLGGRPSYLPNPIALATGKPAGSQLKHEIVQKGFGARQDYGQESTQELGDLYGMLLDLLTSSGSGAGVPDVNPIYDNMIASAEGRVGRGREDIEGMYAALGDDYERLAPQQKKQAAVAQEEIDELYGQLATNVEGTYSRIAEEQGDLFEQLGIEAAAPEVMAPQAKAAAAGSARAQELGAINEQRYLDMGNIDQTYYREGSPLARMTGANLSSDLAFQLEDYVRQVESERAAAQVGAQQQAASQAASQQQSQAQMLWQILQAQLEAQNASPDTSPQGILSSLPPQLQYNVGTAIRQIERTPEAIYGAVEDSRHPVPGTFRSVTDEWWLEQVDKMYERGEIDDMTRQAIMMYLRAANG